MDIFANRVITQSKPYKNESLSSPLKANAKSCCEVTSFASLNVWLTNVIIFPILDSVIDVLTVLRLSVERVAVKRFFVT